MTQLHAKMCFDSHLAKWLCQRETALLHSVVGTGKSLSEALIFPSTNPQYDDRLFIEIRITSSIHENSKLKPGENMLCTEIVSDLQNNLCTQHVLPMFWKRKSFWQRFTCNFRLQILSVFHFDWVSDGQMTHGLGVKDIGRPLTVNLWQLYE